MEVFKANKMFKICGGNDQFCEFDFSKLDYDLYTGIFNGLPNLVFKKVNSLRFSNDFGEALQAAGKSADEKDEEIYSRSIQNCRRRFNHYLFKILNGMLPKSKKIRSLTISGIEIPNKYISDFVPAVANSPSLREFELCYVRVPDKAFANFIDVLSPFKFTRIVFRGCSLLDENDQKIVDFLSKNNKAKKWRLEIFDLTENGFSKDQLKHYLDILKWQVENQITSEAVVPPEKNLSENSSNSEKETVTKVEEEEEEEEANEATEVSIDNEEHPTQNDNEEHPTQNDNEEHPTQNDNEEESKKELLSEGKDDSNHHNSPHNSNKNSPRNSNNNSVNNSANNSAQGSMHGSEILTTLEKDEKNEIKAEELKKEDAKPDLNLDDTKNSKKEKKSFFSRKSKK